jgi:hypothetical protein
MSVQNDFFAPTPLPMPSLFPKTRVVGIAIAPQPGRSDVRISLQAIDFSLLPNVQTGSGAQHAPYSMGTGVICREFMFCTDFHLPPRLRMSGAVPLLLLYAFVA